MRRIFSFGTLILLLAAVSVIGCSGARAKKTADPMALLSVGRYAEAREAVFGKISLSVKDKAILALSYIAEKPGKWAGKEAIRALTGGADEISSVIASREMMGLLFDIPQPVEYEVAFIASEAALGAMGQGPLAPSGARIGAGDMGPDLSVTILERVYLTLIPVEVQIEPDRLLRIWNGCFILSGGSTEATDDVQAWRLFQSVGGLAVIMSKAAPDSDLTDVLLTAAVSTVESNPNIAFPARCDLSSPFDDLKYALAHNRELLGRLEMAVAAAVGCSRGTYAPQTK